MVTRRWLRAAAAGALAAACNLFGSAAAAQESVAQVPETAAPSELAPRLHHAPISVATSGEDLVITGSIEHPEAVKRAVLYYVSDRDPEPREAVFERAASAPYAAVIPRDSTTHGYVAYWIEIELENGGKVAAFASAAHPHVVAIPELPADARERTLLNRLQGRRSVFSLSADYVDFGHSEVAAASAAGATPITVRDRYYRIEGGYTYRLLRTVVEFSLHAGVVRGTSPVPVTDQDGGGDPFGVGLNYGAPSARFRLNDACTLEAEFLTSVTEDGFAVGVGGAVLIGDAYGMHLTLGSEHIGTFGSRFFSRLDVPMGERLTLGPIVEVTNMPHADEYGVRLLAELTFDLGNGFDAGLRGGYQARLATDGGPGAGATLSYSF